MLEDRRPPESSRFVAEHAFSVSGPASRRTSGSSKKSLIGALYDLGRLRVTGVLRVRSSRGDVLEMAIREGSALTHGPDALGRRAALALDELAGLEGAFWWFRAESVSSGGRALLLSLWVREHLGRQVDVALAERIEGELGQSRVSIANPRALDVASFDVTDRAIFQALSLPRSLRDLAHLARAPRFRVLGFVHFLSLLNVLAVESETQSRGARRPPARHFEEPQSARFAVQMGTASRAHACRLLGLPLDADGELVRRTFKKMVRALHPDLQPGIDLTERRRLELRLAHVNAAYLVLQSA